MKITIRFKKSCQCCRGWKDQERHCDRCLFLRHKIHREVVYSKVLKTGEKI